MKKALLYFLIALIVLAIATGAGLLGLVLIAILAPIALWYWGGPRVGRFFGPWPAASEWRQTLAWAAPTELFCMGFTLVTGALLMKYTWLKAPTDQIETPLLAFLVIISPPIEEALFRGWLFRSFEKRIGTWAAMLTSSIIFGALHMDPGALGKVLSGILFCTLVKRTGGLWIGIGLHLLSNLLVFSLTFVPEHTAGLSEARQMLVFGTIFMVVGLPWARRAARITREVARETSPPVIEGGAGSL